MQHSVSRKPFLALSNRLESPHYSTAELWHSSSDNDVTLAATFPVESLDTSPATIALSCNRTWLLIEPIRKSDYSVGQLRVLT